MIFYKIRRTLKEEYSILISLVLVIFIFLLFVFTLRSYVETAEKQRALEIEVDDLNRRTEVLKNNRSIIGDSIDDVNKMLTYLIPDREDFFSIISAIENIAVKSGITVEEYDINLRSVNSEKMSVDIKFSGDTSSFVDFLKNYHFSGGRLITITQVDFGNKLASSKVKLNFYNKKNISSESLNQKVSKLTQEDIKALNSIKAKINIVPVSEASSSSVISYPTKNNPF